MTDDLLFPFAFVMTISVAATLYARLRRQYVSAHAINLIPVALVSAVNGLAVVTHTAGQVTVGGLVLLAMAIGLVALSVVAAVRSARWPVVFWLTWLVDLGLIGGLVYLRFFFRIF